jgi:hypothetical protein
VRARLLQKRAIGARRHVSLLPFLKGAFHHARGLGIWISFISSRRATRGLTSSVLCRAPCHNSEGLLRIAPEGVHLSGLILVTRARRESREAVLTRLRNRTRGRHPALFRFRLRQRCTVTTQSRLKLSRSLDPWQHLRSLRRLTSPVTMKPVAAVHAGTVAVAVLRVHNNGCTAMNTTTRTTTHRPAIDPVVYPGTAAGAGSKKLRVLSCALHQVRSRCLPKPCSTRRCQKRWTVNMKRTSEDLLTIGLVSRRARPVTAHVWTLAHEALNSKTSRTVVSAALDPSALFGNGATSSSMAAAITPSAAVTVAPLPTPACSLGKYRPVVCPQIPKHGEPNFRPTPGPTHPHLCVDALQLPALLWPRPRPRPRHRRERCLRRPGR